ncbi:MAG: ribosome maturation factor RimP [Gammaproteobacteria bacterium]|nr:ribosome maturation factor RimP [Gammaproteobacteria bacterium]
MKGTESVIERTVSGLGYELVEAQVALGGRLLRVFIDRPAGFVARASTGPVQSGISVEDCERVSRQLERVLPVEGIDFDRLEVSSPGLDRVLKTPAHFRRFAGERAEIRLRVPVGNRRRFTGVLRGANDQQVELEVEGNVVSFPISNLERARLVPKLSLRQAM